MDNLTLFNDPRVLPLKALKEYRAGQIYQAYPRKIGRRAALKKIEEAITRLEGGEFNGMNLTLEEAVEGLLKATITFASSAAGQRGIYTPHPTTWFNQSRYLDEVKEWSCVEPKKITFAEQGRINSGSAAEAYLADRGITSADGTAIAFQPRIEQDRLRGVGQTSLALSRGGD